MVDHGMPDSVTIGERVEYFAGLMRLFMRGVERM